MRYGSAIVIWALQSFRHRLLRSGLTITGIAIATAVVVSGMGFFRGYRNALSTSISRLGFQVVVTAKGCPYEAATLILRGGVIPMYLEELVAEEIAADEDVDTLTRFFLQAVKDPERDRFQLYMGIDDRFHEMKPWLRLQQGEWFRSDDAEEMILGFNVAQEWRARNHQQVDLRNHRFTVTGILDRSGTQDDGTVFLPLRTAQKVFDKKGKVTGLGIRLKNVDRLSSFTSQIYNVPSTQVITMSQVQKTILNLITTARFLVAVVALVGLFIAVLGVANSVMMAVVERIPDLGILRAVGGRRRDLFLLTLGEGVILSLAGTVTGILLAILAARGSEAVLRTVLPYSPVGSLIQIGMTDCLEAAGIILLLGLLGAFYPALRAARVPPMASIRAAD